LAGTIVEFDRVGLRYGTGAEVLRDLDFRLGEGGFYFLTGPSGAGKTSLLKLLYLAQRPTRGRIGLFGAELSEAPREALPHYRRRIGVVFQDFRLLEYRTVEENVGFALQVIGKQKSFIDETVPETLELVGLEGKGDRFPDELSGGEQQRVAIARAFVNRPMILIADEPTGNLDPNTSVGIMKLLDRINRTGTTVIMATHDAGIVDQMRKRVIELEDGRVVRDQDRGVYGYQS